jgi:Domain of unknown function (DUF3883)
MEHNHNHQINKETIRKNAERTARHNDMKQHADKLIQGFEKLSDQHAKRAIWELFQNAIDLSENCEITIRHSPTEFRFSHNGKPFDDNTLNCLIKQVSSKSADDNDEQVGQYGTGFITTHSFGRRFNITGSLKVEDLYIPLINFPIDRSSETAPELIDALIDQERKVFELLENGDYIQEYNPTTTFAYQTESDLQKQYASDALLSVPTILPYVMRLNERLKKVTVFDLDNNETTYTKGATKLLGDMLVTEILVNEQKQVICSIESSDSEVTVILPLNEQKEASILPSDISRLFLFYPLIGTEKFGMNFIVHSKQFAPTEPRDGIHLRSKNEQTQKKETDNRKLMEIASNMIFNFLSNNAAKISYPIILSAINFGCSGPSLLDSYFKELKTMWVDKLMTLPLVDSHQRLTPNQVAFLGIDLLAVEEETLDAIYDLVSKYWKNVPQRSIAKQWTNVVLEWNNPGCTLISIKDLVSKISLDVKLENFDNVKLQTFYKYLIQKGHSEFFSNTKLLPNIKGDFRLLSELNIKQDIPPILVEIADTLAPEISKRHIDEQFVFDLQLSRYTRKQFSSEINAKIGSTFSDKSQGSSLQPEQRLRLVQYCKIAPLGSTSVPSKLMQLTSKYYGISEDLIDIGTLTNDDLDIRPAQRKLIKLLLNELASKDPKWAEQHLSVLQDLISLGSTYADYEELFLSAAIFPNQYYELCVQTALQVDGNIPEEIKLLYDKVVRPKKPIKSELVLNEFAEYLKSQIKRGAKSLTDEIEKKFSGDGYYTNIKDHPFQKEILEIIEKMGSDSDWAEYFPLLNGKKANIMLDRVSDPEIKADVFSIISLDGKKIKKLGELARNIENIDEIVALGKQAYDDRRVEKANFQFKHAIGTRIEDLIREKIGKDLNGLEVKVDNVQNGQDIIIRKRNGQTEEFENTYFIEVKSRWKSDSSITMSRNQFMFAALNSDKYALCCVEMSDYKRDSDERYTVDDINIIFNRIKVLPTIGRELSPLVTGMLATHDVENEITLTGDYRATIPQSLVKRGEPLDIFINILISRLQ